MNELRVIKMDTIDSYYNYVTADMIIEIGIRRGTIEIITSDDDDWFDKNMKEADMTYHREDW